MTIIVLFAASAVLASVATGSAPQKTPTELRWTLNPETTEIRFLLGATLHTVRGSARLERGELTFPASGGEVLGEIVIDARSLDTANRRRDRVLHSRVLESELFPWIVLRRIAFDGPLTDPPSSVTMRVELELHGQSRALELSAVVTRSDGQMSVSTRFEIPYLEWGIKDPSKALLRVHKSVLIEISAHGTLAAVAP